jgi:hypothetical protein
MQWGCVLGVLEGREVGETEVKCCAAYGLGGEAKTTSNVVCACACVGGCVCLVALLQGQLLCALMW